MLRFSLLVLEVCLLLVAACAPIPATPSVPTRVLLPSTDTPVPSPLPETSPEPSLMAPESVVPGTDADGGDPARLIAGQVLTALANRLQVAPEEIGIRAIESGRWSGVSCDAALEVDRDAHRGLRIVLEHREQLYVFHADDSGQYVACEPEARPAEGEPVILDTSLGAVVDLAQRNLATRLDLPVRRVFVVEAAPALWTTANLGCGPGDAATLTVPVAGYRIVLRAGTTEYHYHANYRQVVLCGETLLPPDSTRPAGEHVTASPQ